LGDRFHPLDGPSCPQTIFPKLVQHRFLAIVEQVGDHPEVIVHEADQRRQKVISLLFFDLSD